MNKVDKSWWRQYSKKYCFNVKNVRRNNEYLLNNATKWRIVTISLKHTGSGMYIIEGFVDNEWKFLKGTDVMYSTPNNHWYRNYENAYNRCKKIARKFSEIKMNSLIFESAYASMKYGAIGYKNDVELKDL